jgi:hypothetical protein
VCTATWWQKEISKTAQISGCDCAICIGKKFFWSKTDIYFDVGIEILREFLETHAAFVGEHRLQQA